MTLQYCFNTRTIATETLPKKIQHVAKAGFSAIEMWFEEIDQFCKEGGSIEGVRNLLKDNGLSLVSSIKVEGWFETDGALMGVEDDHQQIMGECRRRMETIAQLECPYIIACPSYSHRGHSAEFQTGVDYFSELMDLGREIGVIPTIEFLGQSGQINTIEICIEFLKQVNDPMATMVVDSYHLWRGAGTVEGFTKADKESISLLHINDNNPVIERKIHRDRERLMPGDGSIDLKRFIQIAREINFSGPVSLGVYNPEFWEQDSLAVCTEGYKKLSGLVKRALDN